MPAIRGNNLPKVKRQNAESIKALLYRGGPLSRGEIAERLSLTPSTITNIVGELMDEGVVHELPPEEAGEQHLVGRKPVQVDFVSGSRLALGISLGRMHTQYCLTDLRGNIVYSSQAAPMADDYDTMLAELCTLVARLREICTDSWPRLLGIGLVVPGIVDVHEGVILNSGTERVSWAHKPLAQALCEAVGLPVRIENNTRGRVCATTLFHPDIVRDSPTYAFCYVSWGIACPLVLRTSSYSGEEIATGEIGHMILDQHGPSLPDCGEPGSLESLSSTRAILARCRQLLVSGEPTLLRHICSDPAALTLDMVLEAQRRQDAPVCRILTEAIAYLGIALSNILDFVKPHLLIISGPIFRYPPNVEALHREILAHAFSAQIENLRFVQFDLGEYGEALGAAAVCVEKYFIRD